MHPKVPDNLQVWDKYTFKLKQTLLGHTGSVLALEYAGDKEWLFSSSGTSWRLFFPAWRAFISIPGDSTIRVSTHNHVDLTLKSAKSLSWYLDLVNYHAWSALCSRTLFRNGCRGSVFSGMVLNTANNFHWVSEYLSPMAHLSRSYLSRWVVGIHIRHFIRFQYIHTGCCPKGTQVFW